MKAKSESSDTEKKILILIAFAAFAFSIFSFVSYNIEAEIERTEYFRQQEENRIQNKIVFSGPYCYPDRHPQFLFTIILLVGLTFLSICLAKLYLFSFFFTIASISRFIYQFFETRDDFNYDQLGIFSGVNRIFYYADKFDPNLAVNFLLLVLLFWQISILLRMLIKTSQRKNVLP
jgi:hypothetical protein